MVRRNVCISPFCWEGSMLPSGAFSSYGLYFSHSKGSKEKLRTILMADWPYS